MSTSDIFKKIHECEIDGVRCTILQSQLTGAVIKTWVPLPRVPIWYLT